MSNHFKDILVHTENGVMTLTLNRVDKKNSITSLMYAAMADALESANHEPAVRAVVIQGHESIFSAGNDIGDFLTKPPAAQDSPVFRFMRGISSFPKPLVAAVCGPAVGIGTTLLLHCDLVYAGDNAAFSLPFVNLGLCPEVASSFLVPQLMGYPRAAEALLLGEPFTAETALEIGLINRIVPPLEANALAQRQAPQAGGQTAHVAVRDQTPHEERQRRHRGRAHGRRGRKLRPHVAGAGGARSVHRVHGQAQTRFLQSLR